MQRVTFKLLIIALLCMLQGCISFNSLADAKNAKGEGLVKEYRASKQEVWRETLAIIRQSKLRLVDDNIDKGIILAQQPIAPLSLTVGQHVAIFLTDYKGITRVEVVNKKAVGSIEFTSTDWEHYIVEALSKHFG